MFLSLPLFATFSSFSKVVGTALCCVCIAPIGQCSTRRGDECTGYCKSLKLSCVLVVHFSMKVVREATQRKEGVEEDFGFLTKPTGRGLRDLKIALVIQRTIHCTVACSEIFEVPETCISKERKPSRHHTLPSTSWRRHKAHFPA